MSKAVNRLAILALSEECNENARSELTFLGDGKRIYTERQREYVLSQVDFSGVRATSRILKVPRRTIQRWCRKYGKRVRRCPYWVYEWAERRRKRREFWERRGCS